MNKYLKISIFSSIIYLVLLVSSIFIIDLIDNRNDMLDYRADESDKMLILEKTGTYRFYEDDFSLILVSFIAAPMSTVTTVVSEFNHPIDDFYFKDMNVALMASMFTTYILLPILWIVYSLKLFRSKYIYSDNSSKYMRLISMLLSGVTLLAGSLLSSFFWTRLIFENFKGFF